MTTEDIKARIAAANEAIAKLEADRELEQQLRDVEYKELLLRCEKDYGRKGDAFEIIDFEGEELIVVRRIEGAAVLYKRFTAAMAGGKDPSQEDLDLYVRPCIAHPDKARVSEIFERRPHLKLRCANALTAMVGAKEEKTRSKY